MPKDCEETAVPCSGVGMNPSRLVHISGIQERLVNLHACGASSGDEAREDAIGWVLSGERRS
jgi:hypothetical protein